MPDSGFVFSPAFRVATADMEVVAGGSLEFYWAGTNTATNVYSDSTLSTSLGSVVYLDSGGHPVASSGSSTKVIVYTGSALVKIIVKDADGATLATYDNVRCAQDTSALSGGGSDGGVEAVASKTEDFTVTTDDDGKLFVCDPTGGAFTGTLPSAVTAGDGFEVSFRHGGTTTTNAVMVASVTSQAIARGATTATRIVLKRGGETVRLVSNGATWVCYGDTPSDITEFPIRIVDRLTAPPASPADGAFYIINGTPTDEWSAYAQHDLMQADGGGNWIRHRPYTDCGWIAYLQDEDLLVQYRGSAWVDLDNITAPNTSTLKRALFQEREASGDNADGLTASAWTKRKLNTEIENTITGCSIASSVITLPAGSYLVRAWTTFYFNGSPSSAASAKIRLANTTSTEYVYGGSSFYQNSNASAAPVQHQLHVWSSVTLDAESTFELQYYTNYGTTAAGGVAVSAGSTFNVYTEIEIIDLTSIQGPAGAQGAQGNTGPGYYATSTSSVAIASSGSKTFTTQAGLAYAAGIRVRVADTSAPSTNYMEGVVTSYSGTTLIFTADLSAGSGTISSWTINAAGDKGTTPAFAIGTIVTGEEGTDAEATITGTAAVPVLNLTIPRGDTGASGSGTAAAGSSGELQYNASGTTAGTSGMTYTPTNRVTAVTPPTDTDPGAPVWYDGFQYGGFSNGPSGQENYRDQTWHAGWNWRGGTRVDTGLPAAGLSFESKFYQSGTFASEFHLQGVDTAGGTHRWMSFFLPHGADQSASAATISVAELFIKDEAGTERVKFDVGNATPVINLSNIQQLLSTNNIPFARQMNAAGNSFIDILKLDNYDRVAYGAPVYVNASPEAEYGSILPINATGMTNNKSVIFAQSNAVTGNSYALQFYNLAATGKVIAAFGNNTANGHVVVDLMNNAGTGDVMVAFTPDFGGTSYNYSVGVDQSRGKFVISNRAQSFVSGDGTDRILIDDNVIEAMKPVKLPSFTVSGLPSASTVGGGSLAYVTDANATTARSTVAGGGSNKVLVMSDGTNWLIMA